MNQHEQNVHQQNLKNDKYHWFKQESSLESSRSQHRSRSRIRSTEHNRRRRYRSRSQSRHRDYGKKAPLSQTQLLLKC